MTYDHWKTTNPADEFLGPDPNERDDEPPEEMPLIQAAKMALDLAKACEAEAARWQAIRPDWAVEERREARRHRERAAWYLERAKMLSEAA